MALVMSSSEPGVKSIMPSLPGPPANVMLEGRVCVRTAHMCTHGPSPPPSASPALVDVDIVHTVSAEGCLGQCLNHMVTLQHHVPLGTQARRGVRLCPDLANPPTLPPSPQRGTFCLLSSRCTCSTKRLSLRLLTEMPEGEDRGQGSRVRAGVLPRQPWTLAHLSGWCNQSSA